MRYRFMCRLRNNKTEALLRCEEYFKISLDFFKNELKREISSVTNKLAHEGISGSGESIIRHAELSASLLSREAKNKINFCENLFIELNEKIYLKEGSNKARYCALFDQYIAELYEFIDSTIYSSIEKSFPNEKMKELLKNEIKKRMLFERDVFRISYNVLIEKIIIRSRQPLKTLLYNTIPVVIGTILGAIITTLHMG